MTKFPEDPTAKRRLWSLLHWLMAAGGALFVIIAVAVVLIEGRINASGKKALASFGSLATGETVTLSDFKVSILTGKGHINGFHVPNSNLGSAKDSFSVEKIDIHIAPLSLIWGPLHVRSIKVTSPMVELETNLTGSNLATILAAASAYVASSSSMGGGKDKLKIDRLTLTNVAVRGTLYPSTSELNITIPSIKMEGLGNKVGGLSVAKFVYQFSKNLITQVQSSVFH